MKPVNTYSSIFSPCTAEQRNENFDSYWEFTQTHGGKLFEETKELANKREKLTYFQENQVRLRTPLKDPGNFYRNYVHMQDDPATLDRKTLMLTCIYKFARHEWVGITGAWDAVPTMEQSTKVTDKISRVHLAEEFCHIRFFDEMLKTCGLDKVEWVPLGPVMERVYRMFPYFPGFLMDTPAFVTELMGVTFYRHLDILFDDILADEPEVRHRVREILNEITVDEIAHVGQRRNFIGPIGIKIAEMMVKPLYKLFFADIPETALLFDVEQLVKDGQTFDFNNLPTELLDRSWVPSYCQA